MDKIFFVLAAFAVGVGALLIPRIAKGATVNNTVENQPGRSGDTLEEIEVTPLERTTAPLATTSPQGIRTNNPFNLKYFNIGWVGETGFIEHPAGKFSVFDTAENGIRAGMINVHTKMTRDGQNTIRKLLTVLSPAFENPLSGFIGFVSQRLNVSPDQPLQFGTIILPLSEAIIRFENGEQPFTRAQLESALIRTGRVG